jgi:shikimate kinase
MRIVLIGFMGVGKTSVAQPLANKLNCRCIDVDSLILKFSEYDSIAEIIDKEGEPFFRDLEAIVTEELVDTENVVISTGAGLPLNQSAIVHLLKKNSTFVLLQAEFDTIVQRLKNDNSRPLFRDKDKARQLFESRLPHYVSLAHHIIDTKKKDILGVVEEIELRIKNGPSKLLT